MTFLTSPLALLARPMQPAYWRTRNVTVYLTLIVAVFGMVARVAQFLWNRPLWYDEKMLAFNLVHRSFEGLLQPLDYNQAAPPLFLLAEKAVISLLSPNALTLRLLPLAAAIASIVLMWRLVHRIRPGAAPLAVGLFATSKLFILYASELKQYNTDIVLALLIQVLAVEYQGRRRDHVALALAGMVAVWASHPAIFVLAGTGLYLLIQNRRQWLPLVVVGAAWLLNFALAYMLFYADTRSNSFLTSYWQEWFFHWDVMWGIKAFFELILLVSGYLNAPLLVVVLAGWVGGLWVLRRNPMLVLLLAPLGLVVIASMLNMYPVFGRLVYFVVPSLMIVVGVGLTAMIEAVTTRHRWRVMLIALILALPVSRIDVQQTITHELDDMITLTFE